MNKCKLNIPALVETLGFQVTKMAYSKREDLFQYKFENGLILSIGVGYGHYASEDTCECAVLGLDDEFISLSEHDDVRGHVDEAGLVELARQVATNTIPKFAGLRSWAPEDEDEDDEE